MLTAFRVACGESVSTFPMAAPVVSQRASCGLLISEGAQPSADGQGCLNTPGIHTDAQVAAWRQVTHAVHARHAHLFIQLMHVGRMSHPDNTPHHRQPVAPSAIAPGQPMFTVAGRQDIPIPRALSVDEIHAAVQDFSDAAERAIDAGSDGVEIHGANGYLIQQFLAPNVNRRSDSYGGSITARAHFASEVATAIADRIGAERTDIRLSPVVPLGGIDEGPEGPDLYRYLLAGLAKLDQAYVSVVHSGNDALLRDLCYLLPNALLINRANRPLGLLGSDVAAGLADAEVVARWALANPDFVERFRRGAPLNEPAPTTFYTAGVAGYTDYPTLDEAARLRA